jgi:radical SAM superfamily enzyme YgiQ (UPF0313 family)
MTRRTSPLSVTFVELPATINGHLEGPISRDVYSFFRLPARAGDLLAAIAKRAGFSDTVSLTPGLRKDGRLSAADWRRLASSDIVGISVITRTAPPSYEAARRIRALNPRATIIFGGPHVSALPEEALQHGDIVVTKEGDHTIAEVLARIDDCRERPHLADVRGVAFKDGDAVVVTPPRPFLTQEELDALPFPVFPHDVVRRLTHQTITTSRGCPHGCEYCAVIQNFGRGYRYLSEDRTMELFRHHVAQTRASIFFADDNFTANRPRLKSLLGRCLSERLRLPKWSCQTRVEAAFDDELLDLMVRAGVNVVMIGFESVNNATLALWHKASTLEKNAEAIRRFHAKGIPIHGMFVLGSDVDTVDTIDQTMAFAKSMDIDTAQFFAITPIPGPPLTQKLEAEGRVLTHDWHLYDAQHVVVRPRQMTPKELQHGIMRAFSDFYSPREGIRRLVSNAPHRVHYCLIRFFGSRLVKRIMKETLPHECALENLNDWLTHVDELCTNYRTRLKDLRARLGEARASLSGAIDRTRTNISDAIDRTRTNVSGAIDRTRTNVSGAIDRTRTNISDAIDRTRTNVSDAIDRTRTNVSGAIDRTRANISGAIDRTRDDLAERAAHFLEAYDERIRALGANLSTLAESYHPFCTRVLDELRAQFRSEAEAVLVHA